MEHETQAAGNCNNYWKLQACIEEIAALRYSPSGTPILDCVLTHTSEVVEAGSLRKAQARIKAVALGEIAYKLQQLGVGFKAVFSGFMTTSARSRSANSSAVSFHIQFMHEL